MIHVILLQTNMIIIANIHNKFGVILSVERVYLLTMPKPVYNFSWSYPPIIHVPWLCMIILCLFMIIIVCIHNTYCVYLQSIASNSKASYLFAIVIEFSDDDHVYLQYLLHLFMTYSVYSWCIMFICNVSLIFTIFQEYSQCNVFFK